MLFTLRKFQGLVFKDQHNNIQDRIHNREILRDFSPKYVSCTTHDHQILELTTCDNSRGRALHQRPAARSLSRDLRLFEPG